MNVTWDFLKDTGGDKLEFFLGDLDIQEAYNWQSEYMLLPQWAAEMNINHNVLVSRDVLCYWQINLGYPKSEEWNSLKTLSDLCK